MTPTPIYLGITDDEALFRKGLRFLIEDFSDIELVLEAIHGQDLIEQLATQTPMPNVLLLDMKMPVLNGLETAKVIKAKYPDIKIVILSTYFSKAFVYNMIEIGAAAYLPKNSDPQEVEHTIKMVVEKGFYYNDEVVNIIRENLVNKKRYIKPSFEIKLTNREQEILQLICEQYTNTEIAQKLFISNRTVDGHRNNLLQKLQCKNTAGLVAIAIQQQLVTISPLQF